MVCVCVLCSVFVVVGCYMGWQVRVCDAGVCLAGTIMLCVVGKVFRKIVN